jgi:hypothetical protein
MCLIEPQASQRPAAAAATAMAESEQWLRG